MSATISEQRMPEARQLVLQGQVQGLGVRPAIVRLAGKLQLQGHVSNTVDGVSIHIEGDSACIQMFQQMLPEHLPSHSSCRIIRTCSVPLAGHHGFCVLPYRTSPGNAADGIAAGLAPPITVDVPPDRAICETCLAELWDSSGRRRHDPFLSCTSCGPRYSLLRSMPYERAATSMQAFPMCRQCQCEYSEVEDRRCHAQTIECPDCGPVIWFEAAELDADSHPLFQIRGVEAVEFAAAVLRIGKILALKGIGGYQLICDATSEPAVQRLRERKQRYSKPFAIMLEPSGRRFRLLAAAEYAALHSSQNPIVITDSLRIPGLATSVQCGLNSIGIFRPTTALHAMLIRMVNRPLVVTSANENSSPIEFDEATIRRDLPSIADGWLHHNRRIERPVDDSVVRVIAGHGMTLRNGRGLTPVRLNIVTSEKILAVGGHQKVACALSSGSQCVLGPHLGELNSLASRERFVAHVKSFTSLYATQPVVIAHDLHPDYFTTRWAQSQSTRTIAIQHHHAHVVSAMIENDLLNETVLGLAFDGTGFGPDETIWGGEFLLATSSEFRRVARLYPFRLPGGETAIREPWRVAVSLLHTAMPELSADEISILVSNGPSLVERILQVQRVLDHKVGPITSSLGRLFDGVASVVLGITDCTFEGEPAMRLESLCSALEDGRASSNQIAAAAKEVFRISSMGGKELLDWRPLIRHIVRCRQTGGSAVELARLFHLTIASLIVNVVDQFPHWPVVLSGGCVQNRFLTETIIAEMERRSRHVYLSRRIPPNDGGLAAGQLAIAAARLQRERVTGTSASHEDDDPSASRRTSSCA